MKQQRQEHGSGHERATTGDPRAPRLIAALDRLLALFLTGPGGGAIRSDLLEELESTQRERGRLRGAGWYLWHATSVLAWYFADRLRGRRWSGLEDLHRVSQTAIQNARPAPTRTGFDLRDVTRSFRRAPAHAWTVVATLGLAMAATLSVYTVVDRVLLTELPWADPDRLVRIDRVHQGEVHDGGISYPDFRDWQEEITAFTSLAGWQRFEGVHVSDGVAESWNGIAGTPGLLSLAGVSPQIGTLGETQAWQPGEQVLYLSHELWTSRFGRDPEIVGRTITVSEASWEIRGVMPPGYGFPEAGIDVWVPLRKSRHLENRKLGILRVFGRLRPDHSLEMAR